MRNLTVNISAKLGALIFYPRTFIELVFHSFPFLIQDTTGSRDTEYFTSGKTDW